MNINLNTLLNNLGGTSVDNSTGAQILESSQLSGTDAGLAILQSLSEGDVISGQILDINQNDILLQLATGVTVKAQMADAFSLNIGDNASFIISDRSLNQITLKLDHPEFPTDIVNKVYEKSLNEAGLPVNEKNIGLVQEFVKQNLPIDKSTLTEATRSMLLQPESTPEDIAYLTKMNIPVTTESIDLIHNLYDFNSNMEQDINDVSNGIMQTADSFTGVNEGKDIAGFLEKTVEIYSGNNSDEPVSATIKQNVLDNLAKDIESIIKEYIQTDPDEQNDKLQVKAQASVQNAQALLEQVKEGNAPAKEILHNMAELVRELPETTHIHKLLRSEALKDITQNLLRQELTIKPEDLSNDNLKKAYAKTINSMHEMESLLNSAGKKDSPLMQTLNGIGRSTEFVNNLNNVMAFVQIPLKMSAQNACGQLHVYKRNKSKKSDLEEQTAMLHLDMDHLGKVDVFVKLCNNNLSTNFCVETEEILDFIEQHIPELSKRLEEQGYNVSITAKSEQKNDFSIKESVIKKENPPVEISRLSFDVRA